MVITLGTGTVIGLFHLEHTCKDLAQCYIVWQLIQTLKQQAYPMSVRMNMSPLIMF